MILTLVITLFAYLSFSRFQTKRGLGLNPTQVWLITLSVAAISLYLNIADGKIFVWHATDTLSAALALAIRRIDGLVAVMAILRNILALLICISMYVPGRRYAKPAYAKVSTRTRF